MWRTRRTRVAQAAGVVQAGVVRTGRHDAGGRAADGVRGTLWVQKEPRCDVRADCYKDIAGFLRFLLKLAISRRTCDIERNLLRGYR